MKYIILPLLTISSSTFAISTYLPHEIHPELELISKQASYVEIKQPKIEKNLHKINHSSVLYTHSQASFEQTGSGQNYDTKNGTGQGIFATFDRSITSDNELDFTAWINQASFKEPADIGGNEIAVQRVFFSGFHSWVWQSDRYSAQFNLGATILSQNPDKFTTNENLVPHYLATGPSLGGTYKYQINETWKLKTGLALTLPTFFKEYGPNSGFHSVSWHYLGNLLVDAKVNRSLSMTFGFIVEGEEHRFDGDGERGIKDASVSYVSFAFPVGVSYVY